MKDGGGHNIAGRVNNGYESRFRIAELPVQLPRRRHHLDPARHVEDAKSAEKLRNIIDVEGLSVEKVAKWINNGETKDISWINNWFNGSANMGVLRMVRLKRFFDAWNDGSLPIDDLKRAPSKKKTIV